MRKIHLLNNISQKGIDLLWGKYELTDNIEEADGLIVRSADMHNLEIPDGLLAVARAGAGVNNIPIDTYAQKGVVVFNTPGGNANAVKELVLAGMLMAARDIHGGMEWLETQEDVTDIAKVTEKEKKNFAGRELYGKSLGVIGLGAVGVKVANMAINLGMHVYGYDPYMSLNAAWNLSRHVSHTNHLDNIFENCDYISLHVPAIEKTRYMINQEAIAKMKPGVVVLNFARDVLVDDDAMAKALLNGSVHRYVTDFPNPKTVKMKGALVLPHLGASTEESEENCAVMAVTELMNYMENGNIINSVNYPSCELGVLNNTKRIIIFNRNIPNMIGQYTSVLAEAGINITDMSNKSRGDVAYTIINVEEELPQSLIDKLGEIDGVFRVRVLG